MGPGEHRQVKGVGAGAAIGVGVGIDVDAARGIVRPMPGIAVAGGSRLGIVGAVKYRQVKRHEAVAALGRLESTGRR